MLYAMEMMDVAQFDVLRLIPVRTPEEKSVWVAFMSASTTRGRMHDEAVKWLYWMRQVRAHARIKLTQRLDAVCSVCHLPARPRATVFEMLHVRISYIAYTTLIKRYGRERGERLK